MAILLRLFSYMGREWKFYCVAFFFLFLYSLCKIFDVDMSPHMEHYERKLKLAYSFLTTPERSCQQYSAIRPAMRDYTKLLLLWLLSHFLGEPIKNSYFWSTKVFSAVFGGFRGGTFTYAQARIDRQVNANSL